LDGDLSGFFMRADRILAPVIEELSRRVRSMTALIGTHQEDLDQLICRIEQAAAPDAWLFADILSSACHRAESMRRAGHAGNYDQLVDAGAWTEAALALAELELPTWKPRRIGYDGGQWHCRLSARPWLVEDFDEVADSCHDVLPLAILAAIVQALRVERCQ